MPETESGCRYILNLGDVGDTFTVDINGTPAEFPDQVMKRVDITGLVKKGRNSIAVTVTSNLYNMLFYEGITTFGLPLSYVPRNYGIWETAEKKIGIQIQR